MDTLPIWLEFESNWGVWEMSCLWDSNGVQIGVGMAWPLVLWNEPSLPRSLSSTCQGRIQCVRLCVIEAICSFSLGRLSSPLLWCVWSCNPSRMSFVSWSPISGHWTQELQTCPSPSSTYPIWFCTSLVMRGSVGCFTTYIRKALKNRKERKKKDGLQFCTFLALLLKVFNFFPQRNFSHESVDPSWNV